MAFCDLQRSSSLNSTLWDSKYVNPPIHLCPIANMISRLLFFCSPLRILHLFTTFLPRDSAIPEPSCTPNASSPVFSAAFSILGSSPRGPAIHPSLPSSALHRLLHIYVISHQIPWALPTLPVLRLTHRSWCSLPSSLPARAFTHAVRG